MDYLTPKLNPKNLKYTTQVGPSKVSIIISQKEAYLGMWFSLHVLIQLNPYLFQDAKRKPISSNH
jgi:hypothetical protein